MQKKGTVEPVPSVSQTRHCTPTVPPERMYMKAIVTENLSKTYDGNKEAVKNLNLTLELGIVRGSAKAKTMEKLLQK